jgi:hypothetical protein
MEVKGGRREQLQSTGFDARLWELYSFTILAVR